MEPTPQSRRMLVLLAILACCALLRAPTLVPTAPWQISLEIAQVRVSFGTAAAPVRNRTFVFEIGQAATRLVRTR